MDEVKFKEKRRWEIPGVRYVFAGAGFLGYCAIYAIRVNINVAIVAMVNDTAKKNASNECPAIPFGNSTAQPSRAEGPFDWSPQLQGVVLGAFYYGYCVSQIPGGRLAEIWGGKRVYGGGILISALLTLLTPLAANCHVGLLIAVRALEGLAQGVTMPAMYALLGRWLPDGEKSAITTAVNVGINVGTVTAMPLAGALCDSSFLGGWPAAFYVVGIFGCLWFVLWCLVVTDSPIDHPFISQQELNYILANQNIDHSEQLPPIPWRKIVTSVPFLALLVSQVGQDMSFYTVVNDLPTYFATILRFDIKKNGFLSSFPYLLQTMVGLAVAFTSDLLIRRNIVSTGFARKFCNMVGSVGYSASLVGVCLSGCDVFATVGFFHFGLAIGGFCYSGYMVNHLDLSPEYAGTLMGIANTISNLTGFIAPLVVGALTEEYQTLQQWRYVFVISIIFLMLSAAIYQCFTTTEKQDWIAHAPSYDVMQGVEHSPSESRKSRSTSTSSNLS